MNSTYIYTQGDLLDEPNTYTYSIYNGEQFIIDWANNRMSVMESLPSPTQFPLYKYQSQYRDEKGNIQTRTLLEYLACQLQSNQNIVDIDLLEKLVQRFEVSKRIHDSYNENWRAIDKTSFHSFDLYILYTEIMMQAYMKFERLDFLNVSLKCIDTLISIRNKLNDDEKSRLANILKFEKMFIENLQKFGCINE